MRRRLLEGLLVAALSALLFLVVEGLASTALLIRDVRNASQPLLSDFDQHTYDEVLGWAPTPGFSVPDMYGEGKDLTVDARGFRRGGERPRVVDGPRILCSGDSFTHGDGVGDEDTWCAQLARRLGTSSVNLGVGGYGIDQAFLRYVHVADELEHDVHVFAFIWHDFVRMRYSRFVDSPKPYLEESGDSLVVRNVPVPRRIPGLSRIPGVLRNVGHAARGLRMFQLFRLFGQAAPAASGELTGGGEPVLTQDAASKVAADIVGSLGRLSREREVRIVLVMLPTLQDTSLTASEPWRSVIERAALEEDVPFLDLTTSFEDANIPGDAIDSMFIVEGRAAGHYNERGHRFIAERLESAVRPLLVGDAPEVDEGIG